MSNEKIQLEPYDDVVVIVGTAALAVTAITVLFCVSFVASFYTSAPLNQEDAEPEMTVPAIRQTEQVPNGFSVISVSPHNSGSPCYLEHLKKRDVIFPPKPHPYLNSTFKPNREAFRGGVITGD